MTFLRARNQTFETTNTRLDERLRIIEDRMGDQNINIQVSHSKLYKF